MEPAGWWRAFPKGNPMLRCGNMPGATALTAAISALTQQVALQGVAVHEVFGFARLGIDFAFPG
jgi:hypothetical protein